MASNERNSKENYLTSRTGIHRLNEDCLVHIFQQLNIADRLNVERVCKYWLSISRKSWYDFKTLTVAIDTWGFPSHRKPPRLIRCKCILKTVLKRCGQHLQKIYFPPMGEYPSSKIFYSIADFCPNLTCIDAENVTFSVSSIKHVAKKCRKLTDISLGNCVKKCDGALDKLFQKNKLRVMRVFGNERFTGRCLRSLKKDCIEEIHIIECMSISLKYFDVIKNLQNLNRLLLGGFTLFNKNDVLFCSNLPNLKYLTLKDCLVAPNVLRSIANLTNLETLNLRYNCNMKDEILALIATNNTQLKKVDITDCRRLTNSGVASIMALKNIDTLVVSNLINITDDILVGMPELELFNCSYCVALTDDGILRLIENSTNLNTLCVLGCNVTNKLIDEAAVMVRNRSNKKVLKINIKYTNIEMKDEYKHLPLLEVME